MVVNQGFGPGLVYQAQMWCHSPLGLGVRWKAVVLTTRGRFGWGRWAPKRRPGPYLNLSAGGCEGIAENFSNYAAGFAIRLSNAVVLGRNTAPTTRIGARVVDDVASVACGRSRVYRPSSPSFWLLPIFKGGLVVNDA